ncbi:MAG: hypothetical protein HY975_03990 [Candidatus Kerfeldbacteria bacterium]|nr:hypothetical protein [Candidatus Kerfeldbacteria bacterium]
MVRRYPIIVVVHSFVALCCGLFLGGLYTAAVALAVRVGTGRDASWSWMLVELGLASLIAAAFIYRRDLPRISPTNVVGLLANLLALGALLGGQIIAQRTGASPLLVIFGLALLGLAVLLLINAPYKAARRGLVGRNPTLA